MHLASPASAHSKNWKTLVRQFADHLVGEALALKTTRPHPTRMEMLEPRCLLASTPLISEFVARNATGIRDAQNPPETSDWIEIHNPAAVPVNMAGYHLTDDKDNLMLWPFPPLTIPAGGYLLLFANGQNRNEPGVEISTNFELDGSGDYLALVASDGRIVSSYNPPGQLEDVSYGVIPTTTSSVVIGPSAPVKAFIPTSNSLGLSWAQRTFDDTSWLSGTGGVGYDADGSYNPLIGLNVGPQMQGINTSAYLRMPFSIGDNAFDAVILKIKYDDGFVAYLNGVEIGRRNAPTGTPDFNATATQPHADNQAVVAEEVLFHVPANLLLGGEDIANQNILAIHGLNAAGDAGDFLISAELVGYTTTLSDERFFQVPTPAAVNNTGGLSERVADTRFSHDRGFYDAPFQLEITTATQGTQIRYTLNGDPPTATTGLLYTGPLTIDKTTVIRAAAFKPGAFPSDIDAQTYLFLDDVIRQSPQGQTPQFWPTTWTPNVTDYGMDPDIVNSPLYSGRIKDALTSIPTFSLVVDLEQFVGPAVSGQPLPIYANPSLDGRAAERPMSLELIYPDGREGFQINGGVRVRGGYSRSTNNPKHGLRFFFRPEYEGALEYPVFGSDARQSFESFDLRTFQNYSWSFDPGPGNGIFVRDMVNRDLQLAMGHDGERGDYFHLYINGQYWGLYNSAERPEASHGAAYFGGDKDDYDVIKVAPDDGYNIYATDGDMAAYSRLWSTVLGDVSGSATGMANYMRLQGKSPDGTDNPNLEVLLDVENLIDYMLLIFYGDNLDAPLSNFISNTNPNNYFALRNKDPSARMGFKFYAHDSEHTFLLDGINGGDVTGDRTGPFPVVSNLQKANPQWMMQLLLANPEFRLRVWDRVQRHFFNNGVLTPQRVLEIFNGRIDQIDKAVVAESARWGDSKRPNDPYERDVEWVAQRDRLTKDLPNLTNDGWIQRRTAIVVDQLRGDLMYPPNSALHPQAVNLSQFGGPIGNNFEVTLTRNQQGEIYYTLDGSDPRLMGGGISPTATRLDSGGKIALERTTTLKARVRLSATAWGPLTEATFIYDNSPLRITEMMYNPAPPTLAEAAAGFTDAQQFEYIELQNTGPTTLNLDGVKFSNGIRFTFPKMTLAPSARTLVVKNLAAFQFRYGTGLPVAGVYLAPRPGELESNLDNNGERITIVGPGNENILNFRYNNWYPSTEGAGYSLVVRNPFAPQEQFSDSDNYAPGDTPGGVPGGADPFTTPDTIRFSEVLATASTPGGDFIELQNTGFQDLNISGWFISNDELNLTKFRIPDGTIIPAQGFVAIGESAFGSAFTLTGGSTNLHLSNNSGTRLGGYREFADFSGAAPDVAIGRVQKSTGGVDFTALTSPTPAAANAGAMIGPIVINEVMYNPPQGQTITEFIELFNLTGAPVSLFENGHAWKLEDAVSFSFPSNAVVPASGYALVVGINPSDFRTARNIPGHIPIYGPWTGSLDNDAEDIQLTRPGVVENNVAASVVVDKVKYEDGNPWPSLPDGTGSSLARVFPERYGNDPGIWSGSLFGGTPGAANGETLPVINLASTAIINQGAALSQPGSFVDNDTGQTWQATVNWGDGTGTQNLLLVNKTFTLSRAYANPGTYQVAVTVRDNLGGSATSRIELTVLPGARSGGSQPDTFLVRRDPTGQFTQFFENVDPNGTPSFSIRTSLLNAFSYSGNAGIDTFIIDLTNGNPIPSTGIEFNGGSDRDDVKVIGSSGADVVHLQSGRMTIGGNAVTLAAAENFEFSGGGGNDVLNTTGTLSIATTYNGGEGVDELNVTGRTSNDSFTLTATALSTFSIGYSNLDRIQIDGLAGDDTFTLAATIDPAIALSFIGNAGNDTLRVASGTNTISSSVLADQFNLNMQASNPANPPTLNINSSLDLGGVTINSVGRLNLTPGGGKVLRTTGFTIGASGQGALIDLSDNDLVVSAAADQLEALLDVLNGHVKRGRDSGTAGILSSAASNDLSRLTTLAVVKKNGQAHVKYTWAGDLDGSGAVTLDDLFTLDASLLMQPRPPAVFRSGDIDYSGVLDLDDRLLMDRVFLGQGDVFA